MFFLLPCEPLVNQFEIIEDGIMYTAKHKEESYFTPEITWLQHLYDTYQPAVPLADYLVNQPHYFTHTPDWNGLWNRKLDCLFTNYRWITGSDATHQSIMDLSDHIPVSANWEAPK